MWRPELWLALLRVVVGALVLRAAWPKFTVLWWAGAVPYPVVSAASLTQQTRRLSELAAGTPFAWHRDFLRDTVLPHATLASTLQAWAEVAIGVGLILGLLTGLAALVGLLLAANTALAAHVAGTGPGPMHALLIAAMVAFLGSRAGRAWGLDAAIHRRASRGARVLLSLLT